MAEAAVENPIHNTFYCHQCTVSINPKLPDFTCPRCDNGFIEEITEDANRTETSVNTPAAQPQQHPTDPATHLFELYRRAFSENFGNLNAERDEGVALAREQELDDEQERTRQQPHGLQPPPRRVPNRRQILNPLQGLFQLFPDMTGRGQFGLNILPLHGNPDDYAWGVGGLDAIITQLLNQLDGSGVPPAQQEKIEALPVVKISQKQVDNILQCSVCMEDFHLNEEVKKLPCDHHFHGDCIVPWLRMHATCPVCRKGINGDDISHKGSLNPYDDAQMRNNYSNGT